MADELNCMELKKNDSNSKLTTDEIKACQNEVSVKNITAGMEIPNESRINTRKIDICGE